MLSKKVLAGPEVRVPYFIGKGSEKLKSRDDSLTQDSTGSEGHAFPLSPEAGLPLFCRCY